MFEYTFIINKHEQSFGTTVQYRPESANQLLSSLPRRVPKADKTNINSVAHGTRIFKAALRRVAPILSRVNLIPRIDSCLVYPF